MIWLPEAERAGALALNGAAPFDPMGNGRVRSDKIMLPESMMKDPVELRRWIARAFRGAAALPAKSGAKTTRKPAARKPTEASPKKKRSP
jgi:hypothetical protein